MPSELIYRVIRASAATTHKTGDQYLERDLEWGVGQAVHRADPRYLMNVNDQTFYGRKGWWD